MTGASRRLTPDQALRGARVIAIALLASALLIAAIGFALTLSAELSPGGAIVTMLFAVWVAAAMGAIGGWWVLWRGAANLAAGPGRRPTIETDRRGPEKIFARLAAAYSLLEAQLIVALVTSLLHGTPMLLVPALAIVALGLSLSFPRREWFARLDGSPSPPLV